jgi:hypothetical protein
MAQRKTHQQIGTLPFEQAQWCFQRVFLWKSNEYSEGKD